MNSGVKIRITKFSVPAYASNAVHIASDDVDDYFDNQKYFHNEKDLELSHFDQDPLLADLEFSAEISNMVCFKETFSA